MLRTFIVCTLLWRLCAGDIYVCRVAFSPDFQPAYSCHPFFLEVDWAGCNHQ